MSENERKAPKWLRERVQSLEQLNNEDLPELDWIVARLLTEGLTVFAGMLKAGKSYLIVNIGLAVAEGRLALGELTVKQGRVLYISPDDKQKTRLRARIKAMREGRDEDIPFDIATTWKNLDEGGVDELREYIEYYEDTRLVIVDVLMNLLPGISEDANAYDRIYQKREPLKALAQEKHIAIVLVMHMNKGGQQNGNPRNRIYGSMAYGAIADNIMMLDENYATKERSLLTSGKDLDQDTRVLAFNRETGVYTFSMVAPMEKPEEKTVVQGIGEMVKAHPGITNKDLKAQLIKQKVSESASDQRIARALRDHEICKEAKGYVPCVQKVGADLTEDSSNDPDYESDY